MSDPEKPAEPEQLTLLTPDTEGLQLGKPYSEIQIVPSNKIAPPVAKTGWRRYGGLIFTLTSSITFSLTIAVVKMVPHYHPYCIAVWRFFGILIPSIPIVLFFQFGRKKNVFEEIYPWSDKEKRWNALLLAARGFCATSMVITRFYAVKYLTVADVSVLSHTGPVFVTILAHFFLKEKCGWVQILLSIFTSLGVFIIIRPPFLTGSEGFDTNMLIGSSLALLSMVCTSLVIILARKQRKIHFSIMLLVSGIWGVSQSSIFAASAGVMEVPRGAWDMFLIFGAIPTLVFIAQLSIILALKFERAGPVALMRTCDVIFSFIWQIILLSVLPDIFSYIGAGIVILGVVVTTIRTMLSALPPEDPTRRRFRFLLL